MPLIFFQSLYHATTSTKKLTLIKLDLLQSWRTSHSSLISFKYTWKIKIIPFSPPAVQWKQECIKRQKRLQNHRMFEMKLLHFIGKRFKAQVGGDLLSDHHTLLNATLGWRLEWLTPLVLLTAWTIPMDKAIYRPYLPYGQLEELQAGFPLSPV